MKFDYLVKHDGVYYPAGTDVPIETTSGEGVKAPAVDVLGKVDEVMDGEEENREVEEVEPRKPKYTDEDLDVPYFSLIALAKKEGLNVPDKAKTGDIKKMLRAL